PLCTSTRPLCGALWGRGWESCPESDGDWRSVRRRRYRTENYCQTAGTDLHASVLCQRPAATRPGSSTCPRDYERQDSAVRCGPLCSPTSCSALNNTWESRQDACSPRALPATLHNRSLANQLGLLAGTQIAEQHGQRCLVDHFMFEQILRQRLEFVTV